MSRTLFFYIFKDLLRIFFLTSGALAGIMSFGGLLRPLTEHGLDAGQAAKMLSYFMPAMTTYSLPIAALFATTMVYGRLSADNEIVACRAAGISYGILGGVSTPALVMGLLVSIVSLLFLCFVVPVFTLKVERVIYSNLAQLIANQIQRTHQIKFKDSITIFAQDAAVGQDDPSHPEEQSVTLAGLMIISFDKDEAKGDQKLQIPREFYLARDASVFIRRSKSGEEFTLDAKLTGGSMFPRKFNNKETTHGGLEATTYGPIVLDSVIKEDTKFMDIRRLHDLYGDLRKSRRVQEQLQKIIRARQEAALLHDIDEKVKQPGGRYEFDAGSERYELTNIKGISTLKGSKLIIGPSVKVVQKDRDGRPTLTADASEVELSSTALGGDRLSVQAQLRDVVVEAGEGPLPRPGFTRTFVVKSPLSSEGLESRGLAYFRGGSDISHDERLTISRELMKIENGIISEVHARISFAVSCLILVLVGCYLGMMFKSGNFLSAFALSVMPALLSVALIVAGQHTAMNIPYKISASFQNPLNLGLGLIWSGNVAALALALVLGIRMQRQ